MLELGGLSGWRQLGELGQTVLDWIPGCFARHKDVPLGQRTGIGVEQGGRHQDEGHIRSFHGRAASATHAKRNREAFGVSWLVAPHQLAPHQPGELVCRVEGVAAMRGTTPTTAARTMTLKPAGRRATDREGDRATQAASAGRTVLGWGRLTDSNVACGPSGRGLVMLRQLIANDMPLRLRIDEHMQALNNVQLGEQIASRDQHAITSRRGRYGTASHASPTRPCRGRRIREQRPLPRQPTKLQRLHERRKGRPMVLATQRTMTMQQPIRGVGLVANRSTQTSTGSHPASIAHSRAPHGATRVSARCAVSACSERGSIVVA